MKYYCHDCDSLDRPTVNRLLNKFGHKGYTAWHGTLEILGQNDVLFGPKFFDWEFLTKKLRLSADELRSIYRFLSKDGNFFAYFKRKGVALFSHSLAERADDWTKRLIREGKIKEPTPEQLRSNSGLTPEQLRSFSGQNRIDKNREEYIYIHKFINNTFKDRNDGAALHIREKHENILCELAAKYTLDQLKVAWTTFLDEDPETKKIGCSIKAFESRLNYLMPIVAKKLRPRTETRLELKDGERKVVEYKMPVYVDDDGRIRMKEKEAN